MFHETEDTHYKAFQYMQMNSLYVRRTQKVLYGLKGKMK